MADRDGRVAPGPGQPELGTFVRLSPRGAQTFTHVAPAAFSRKTSTLHGTAYTLLDAASYGIRVPALGPGAQLRLLRLSQAPGPGRRPVRVRPGLVITMMIGARRVLVRELEQ